ncbi:MAG: endolytic transglycosylase MltG [Protaetiibacter sp.]
MASEPSWDDIFGPVSAAPAVEAASDEPESQTAAASRRARGETDRTGSSARLRRRGRRRGPWGWIIATVVIVGVLAGGGVYVWSNYGEKIQDLLGIAPPTDYTGDGNGEEVTIVIESGDIGSDVATKLEQAGVTMTFDAVYQLLLADDSITFEPGNYRLEKQMSAEAAIAALQDPANKIVNQVTIPEGVSAESALELIAAATGLDLAELQTQAANYTQFGVPAEAPSIEGFLFPATYTFDPGVSATDAIKMLVDTMFEKLDAAGVATEDRLTVLTLASIVQREAANTADMPKIARVFQNRLDRGMNLQSDATVAYGTGNTHTVWTTQEERDDASNPYNTYANPGLPIGPIGLPGLDAIDAALHPAEGSWLYFVPINLKTGETVFSNTLAEHDAAAQQLYDWCEASDENAAYCD